MLASLKHPHIARLYNILQDDAYSYLITELCDCGNLYDFVNSYCKGQVYTPSKKHIIRSVFRQVLNAVEYMHANNLYHHCDSKIMENVLLKSVRQQNGTICKEADFGFATRTRSSIGFGCGSEVCLGREHLNINERNIPYYSTAASDFQLTTYQTFSSLIFAQ